MALFLEKIFKIRKSLQLLLISLLLIYFRDSRFLTHPRLWAEEGPIYLLHAIKNGFWGVFYPNLDQSASIDYINYYSFLPNFATYIGVKFFPLEYLAHVTTYISAFFQLFTVFIIFRSAKSLIYNKNLCMAVALSPIIFGSAETWLNSINIQFWFTTGILFILSSKKISKIDIFYSAISFFTSVGSLFFLPFILLRLIRDKFHKKSIFILSILGTSGLIFQSLALISSGGFNSRFKFYLLKNLPKGLVSTLIPRIIYISDSLGSNNSEMFYNYSMILIILFFVALLIGSIYVCKQNLRNNEFNMRILIPIVSYWFLATFTSLNMSGGERYGLPVYSGSFFIMIIASEKASNILKKRFILFASLFFLVLRMFVFFETEKFYGSNWSNWKDQVIEMKNKKDKNIKVFPQWENTSIWQVDLELYR